MCRGLTAASCAAFIATTAAACGTVEQVSAAVKIDRAVSKLTEQKSLTMTVDLDASEARIWSVLKGEEDFTRENATMLADLGMTFTASSDQALKDATTGDAAATVSVGASKGLVEYRVVDEKFYVRVDAKKLISLAGDNGGDSEVEQFESLLESADELPSSYRSVKDLLGGKWISIDPKGFQEFADSMGEDTDSGSGAGSIPSTDTLDPKTQRKLAEAVAKAIGDSAKFTDAGSRDGADHVKVTVPAAKAAKALAEGLKPLEKQLPESFPLSDLNDVPDRDVVLDVAVEDGTLSEVTIDVAQFEKGATAELPLVIGFAAGGDPVEAPAGASQLNPQDLAGAMMQMFMRGADGQDLSALQGLGDLEATT